MDVSNWFGRINGTYFGEPPLYVDKRKAPGMTSVPSPSVRSWIQKSPTLLLTSPNFVWWLVSLLFYWAVPYDLSPSSTAAIAPLSMAFLAERFPLWASVTLGYISFWHLSLYWFSMASRPFIKNRVYSVQKVLHNLVWTTSGILIWTCFENAISYAWATNRLPYVNDTSSLTTVSGALQLGLGMMAIPVWRSVHFYVAHRFLHFKAMYQQVHSLHHRNTDVEPFSGLCMHPIEHLYYYSCIAPSLLISCSPYIFVWTGIHLLLSPAASHSGYEDHFQSDLFHYLHHRYFECNYAGSDAGFLDKWCGTFMGSFEEHPVDKEGPRQREDSKSTLVAYPTREFLKYMGLSTLCLVPYGVVQGMSVSPGYATMISSLVGVGPVIAAMILTPGSLNEGVPSLNTAVHGLVGVVACCIPIAYLCWITLL